MEITRIFDILDRYQSTYPEQNVALAGKVNKEWIKYSPKEYFVLMKFFYLKVRKDHDKYKEIINA